VAPALDRHPVREVDSTGPEAVRERPKSDIAAVTGLKFNPAPPISYASYWVKQGGLTVVCQDGRPAVGQQMLDLTMQARQVSLVGLAARRRIDATNPARAVTTDPRSVEARYPITETRR
jgi:hypothetical protein